MLMTGKRATLRHATPRRVFDWSCAVISCVCGTERGPVAAVAAAAAAAAAAATTTRRDA